MDVAFQRVRKNLDSQGEWLSGGQADLTLEAEKIRPAALHYVLKPDNRGHTFYDQD